MSQYYLLQDQKKCIGCLSCEVHCKSHKGLPFGPRLGQIILEIFESGFLCVRGS